MNDNTHHLYPGNVIHPTVIIEGEVSIGKNNIIGPYCYLKGPLTIGDNNHIAMNVMIGADPGHKSKPPVGQVYIGHDNTIREFSIIERGIGDCETSIADRSFFLEYSYIAHDAVIESDVIFSPRVSLAGHCRVLQGAAIGISASLREFTTIGQYALVGMGCVVNKDLPPFCVGIGNPIRFLRFNLQALQGMGIQLSELNIADGALHSGNPQVNQYLQQFLSKIRRPVLPLGTLKI